MTWWALNYLSNVRSWNTLYTVASTTQDDHLFMAWGKHKPSRKAIWRVVRGKTIFCGWQYIWDTPTILEQSNPGDTNWHYFLITLLQSTDHIWYYLFAPEGPYGLEIQGPLVHIPPPETGIWTTKMYVGTCAKGVYYTDTFTGPGGDHPTWQESNAGLSSLNIWQLEPDPGGPQYRHYCIAGAPGSRKVYRRIPSLSMAWQSILTNAQVLTLTGSASGEISWVSANLYFPGHLYVLFNSAFTNNDSWCLRSTDYGDTWTAHRVYNHIFNWNTGNLAPGLTQGTSPYDPGHILYAVISAHALAPTCLLYSLDDGVTWVLRGAAGAGDFMPRLLVDPTDQSITYVGTWRAVGAVRELYRSEAHGATLVEVDGALHLGGLLEAYIGNIWVDPSNNEHAILIATNHIWTTTDYCLNWHDWGLLDSPAARLAILWTSPSHLYLARHNSGIFPPLSQANHVIHVSNDHGIHMQGKAGEHASAADGGGDSIPYNCGGVCAQGMMLYPPF